MSLNVALGLAILAGAGMVGYSQFGLFRLLCQLDREIDEIRREDRSAGMSEGLQ